ncbi:hypothetical protein B0H13DRAFT_2573314 [Mycena leptocephala]|nr:hypothetical protein B0H13DRAFT_2573314 [Mycena leptocephala]
MAWPWFGPISNNMVTEFGITLDEVNWLGNVMACIYLPVSLLVPEIIRRYGIRRCCDLGAAALLVSAWIRYAGTVHSLSSKGAFALLFVGQFFAAIAQPIFQVIGPKYSETWFDLQGILVLGIMSSVAAPFVFMISAAPPTPPTYSASKKAPGLLSLLRVMFSKQPVGYSSDTAGFMGASLLLSGIVAAIVTAPIFDRVLTSHLAITTKILVPVLAAAWLSLVWAVKPNNTGALYAVCVLIGVSSVTMLPVSLELACEITRNSDGSSALLWFACNGLTIIFVLVEGALRAGPGANPPLNMPVPLFLMELL